LLAIHARPLARNRRAIDIIHHNTNNNNNNNNNISSHLFLLGIGVCLLLLLFRQSIYSILL
jgi:hypothetical protein